MRDFARRLFRAKSGIEANHGGLASSRVSSEASRRSVSRSAMNEDAQFLERVRDALRADRRIRFDGQNVAPSISDGAFVPTRCRGWDRHN